MPNALNRSIGFDRPVRGMNQMILETFEKNHTPTPKPNAPTFAITTRLGAETRDPPYPTPSDSAIIDNTYTTIEEERMEGEETTTVQKKETPSPPPYTTPPNHPVFLSLPG
nr:hypothetical protein [Tanacetum cinerariifolium]